MRDNDEELILLATSIAMELSRGLDVEELEDLRNFFNQISCSISNLITRRDCVSKRKKKFQTKKLQGRQSLKESKKRQWNNFSTIFCVNLKNDWLKPVLFGANFMIRALRSIKNFVETPCVMQSPRQPPRILQLSQGRPLQEFDMCQRF